MATFLQTNLPELVGMDTDTLCNWVEMASATYPKLSEWTCGLATGLEKTAALPVATGGDNTINLAREDLEKVCYLPVLIQMCLDWSLHSWVNLDALNSMETLALFFRSRIDTLKCIDDSTLGEWIDTLCAQYPILAQWDHALTYESANDRKAREINMKRKAKQEFSKVRVREF